MDFNPRLSTGKTLFTAHCPLSMLPIDKNNHPNVNSAQQARAAAPERECILCGRCLEVCPLFAVTKREELSPRGKAFLISKALELGELGNPEKARELLGLCLGCGQCARVCPQGRDLPKTLRRLKAEQPGWRAWVWRVWIAQAKHLWPWSQSWPQFLPNRSKPGSLAAMLKALAGKPKALALVYKGSGPTLFSKAMSRPVTLFPGCLARWAKPWWIQNAQTLMGEGEGRGNPSGRPDWNCCGFTLGQAGLTGSRLEACRANIALWRGSGRPMVLTICATCHTALHGYAEEPELFADETERRLWSQGVRPLSEFLDPNAFERLDKTSVLYHRPCHAPSHDPDAVLLQGIFGRAFVLSKQHACCGLGGVLRLAAPELSTRVGRWYWDNVPDSGILRVVTGCGGCVVQASALAPKNVLVTHWLDLFA
jgi:glycolate oxidase iron-sulfur subunit